MVRKDQSFQPPPKKKKRGLSNERSVVEVFPVFSLTFKSLYMMKPSPQSQRFIYENQTPSAISDQMQQPSGQGYQGRTGKAINCQSLHRSTSQSTATPPTHLYPLLPTDAQAWFIIFPEQWTRAEMLRPSFALCDSISTLSLFLLKQCHLLIYLESKFQAHRTVLVQIQAVFSLSWMGKPPLCT